MRPDLRMTLAFRPRENHATLPTAPADPSRLLGVSTGFCRCSSRKLPFAVALTFLGQSLASTSDGGFD